MDVLQVAENIGRRCIPELSGTPVYVVPMVQGRAALPGLGVESLGCYHPQLCRALRCQLESLGTWQGDGAAVAIDVDELHNLYGSSSYAFPRAVTGVLCHELIHWLLRPALPFVSLDDDDAGEVAAAIKQYNATPVDSLAFIMSLATSHGPAFTRLACHVSHRSHFAAVTIDPHWLLFAGAYPGLEPLGDPREYLDALGAELVSRQNEPLLAIAESEPPALFHQTWVAGLQRLRAAIVPAAA
jgi:ribosomal protein S16